MKEKYINNMRAFSRFYTDILGLLDKHILESTYSLSEARILYELYHNKNFKAKDIQAILHIDKGQLSRILLKLEKEQLLVRDRSEDDGRAAFLSLTEKGQHEYELLDKASHNQVEGLLKHLDKKTLKELSSHMSEIQRILSVSELSS